MYGFSQLELLLLPVTILLILAVWTMSLLRTRNMKFMSPEFSVFLLSVGLFFHMLESTVYDPLLLFKIPWVFRAAFMYSPLGSADELIIAAAFLHTLYYLALTFLQRDVQQTSDIESLLEEWKMKYGILADHTYEWEYWIAPDGRYLYVSPSCLRISGFSAEEIMGDPACFLNMVHPRYRDMVGNHMKDVIADASSGDADHSVEFLITTRDGISKWIEHKCVSVFGRDGKYLGRRGVNRDITSRQTALEEKNILSVAVEQSPVSVVITDEEGNITYVNQQFTQVTGYESAEVLGKNPSILKSGLHPDSYYKELWETITGGERWSGEFRNRRKNGDYFWEDSTIGPIMDSHGKITHFLALKTDITLQKKMLENEQQMQNHLIQTNKLASLGVLSAGLAHEINNPNNYILYNAELVKTLVGELLESKDNAEKEKTLEVINTLLTATSEGAMRINKIVESLKSFSRQGGREDLSFDKVHVNDLIEIVLTIMNYHIRKSTDRFSYSPGENIPAAYWDAQKIEQVIMNLLENALHALPDRQSAVNVSTLYNEQDESVEIYVRDEGCGIKHDILDKIMEPFFSTKKDTGGTGLGLSISYAIVRDHRGRITVQSEPEKGTEFGVSLPVNTMEAVKQ